MSLLIIIEALSSISTTISTTNNNLNSLDGKSINPSTKLLLRAINSAICPCLPCSIVLAFLRLTSNQL